jgi:hypothetical protein
MTAFSMASKLAFVFAMMVIIVLVSTIQHVAYTDCGAIEVKVLVRHKWLNVTIAGRVMSWYGTYSFREVETSNHPISFQVSSSKEFPNLGAARHSSISTTLAGFPRLLTLKQKSWFSTTVSMQIPGQRLQRSQSIPHCNQLSFHGGENPAKVCHQQSFLARGRI